jgi:hypothetical protein
VNTVCSICKLLPVYESTSVANSLGAGGRDAAQDRGRRVVIGSEVKLPEIAFLTRDRELEVLKSLIAERLGCAHNRRGGGSGLLRDFRD